MQVKKPTTLFTICGYFRQMRQQHQITYKKSVINYYRFGSGLQLLFCFHGYGASGYQFHLLEKKLEAKFTVIAIDFPFHGSTVWKENKELSMDDLLKILEAIISSSGLEYNEKLRFSLLSYSMGGRIALSLFQKIPEQIECVGLIAPDGLHVNFWYGLSTRTWLGKKWFRYNMHNPKGLHSLLKLGTKTKLLDVKLMKLVHYYMYDKEERLKLYNRWTTMRQFRPHLKSIKALSDNYNVPLRFLFGKNDPLILSKRSVVFEAAENVKIKVIDAGHSLMLPKYVNEIADLLCK